MEEFDAWVTYLFDRPPGRQADSWWDDRPCEWLERYARDDKPVAIAERIRRLFGNAGATLRAYSDEQVGRGLNEIINGGVLYVFGGKKQLPVVLHTRGVRSIVTLFVEIFAPRIQVDEPDQKGELDHVCFMFFDIAALDLGDETVLDVLEDILALPSVPCQRSALHGLGHAQMKAPQQVQAVVDRWLETHRDARQELRDYALAARTGSVM